ncbi:NAD(P)H-hydrate dehydratase [Candidatus Sumerlaeota bacterium]|nr:NAD(P)H-hydrate dehydratase [Candidatus Sumerlaeota bacterium]
MRVVTEEQMREIDRVAIHERGIPSLDLMERAGTACADVITELHAPKTAAVCAGKGNNAGDGFVVARLLSERGVKVELFLSIPPEELRGDALANFGRLPAGVKQTLDPEAEAFRLIGSEADVIVDALLGTGVKGLVRGPMAEMIRRINEVESSPVVAVDIPSGLSDENLAAGGECVHAGVTVTFGLPKRPMVIHPGAEFVGQLVVDDIGFPEDLLCDEALDLNLTVQGEVLDMLPERPEDSHKGTFGHLLIIAGSAGMGGAAAMTAQAAVRSGVGLVTVAVPRACLSCIETHVLSAVKRPLGSKSSDHLDESALDQLGDLLDSVNAVVLGPGIGLAPKTKRLVHALLERVSVPLIIDADGLNALEGETDRLRRRHAPTILTPHPKEMSRLSGSEVQVIQSDRIAAARGFASEIGVTLVLKGARSVIADPGGDVWINPTGNTGLAKGGSGDVLTGLIGGLAAQGLPATQAAIAGVFWHGLAADVALEQLPPQVMVPDDVIGALGEALRQLAE